MPQLNSAKTALLLMDFQNGIVAMLGEAGPALLAKAHEAGERARKAGIAVIHVRVAFTDADYAAISPRNKGFSALAGKHFLDSDSPATAVHSNLGALPGEPVFTKQRVGAFSTTKLAAALTERGIDTLVLAGISTSGVVLSTLRDAADRDFHLFVLADCCADPDAEVHRVLTEKVFPRQADIIDLDTFRAMTG